MMGLEEKCDSKMLADLSEAKRILPVLDLGEEAKSDLKAI